MTRPFLVVGLCALTASFLLLYGGVFEAMLWLGFCAAIIIIINLKKDKWPKGVYLAAVLLLVAVRLLLAGSSAEAAKNALEGKRANIVGFVQKTVYEAKDYTVFAIKAEKSDLPEAEGLLISATVMGDTELIPGDRIEAEVSFTKEKERQRRFLLGSGYHIGCRIEGYTRAEGETFTVWRTVHHIRRAVEGAIDRNVSGEEAAVLKALIIGDPSDISEGFYVNVKNTGISHLIVVSGMHLGLLCGIVFALLQRRATRPVHVMLGILTAIFIATVCLFQASILRAGLTYIVMLFGRLFLKNYDSLSSLGTGILLTVLLNPFIFYNAAFMLSVTATFSVIYPATLMTRSLSFDKLWKLWAKITEYVTGVLIIAFCALVCTLPVVVWYFGYAPLISPIVNLLTELPVNAALVIGVMAVLIYFIPFVGPVVALPIFEASRILISYFIWIVDLIGSTEAGVILIDNTKHIYCFFIALSFIIMIRIFYDKNFIRKEISLIAKRKDPEIVD